VEILVDLIPLCSRAPLSGAPDRRDCDPLPHIAGYPIEL
jgi:hypothetical protein